MMEISRWKEEAGVLNEQCQVLKNTLQTITEEYEEKLQESLEAKGALQQQTMSQTFVIDDLKRRLSDISKNKGELVEQVEKTKEKYRRVSMQLEDAEVEQELLRQDSTRNAKELEKAKTENTILKETTQDLLQRHEELEETVGTLLTQKQIQEENFLYERVVHGNSSKDLLSDMGGQEEDELLVNTPPLRPVSDPVGIDYSPDHSPAPLSPDRKPSSLLVQIVGEDKTTAVHKSTFSGSATMDSANISATDDDDHTRPTSIASGEIHRQLSNPRTPQGPMDSPQSELSGLGDTSFMLASPPEPKQEVHTTDEETKPDLDPPSPLSPNRPKSMDPHSMNLEKSTLESARINELERLVESLRAELKRIMSEVKENKQEPDAETIRELQRAKAEINRTKQSKMDLISSTSNEIQNLRERYQNTPAGQRSRRPPKPKIPAFRRRLADSLRVLLGEARADDPSSRRRRGERSRRS